jgi:YVTN family beta-propeller protein
LFPFLSIITGTITLASSTTPYVTDASSNIQTVDNGTLSPDSASFSFNFTINNISNKDVFISKNGRKSLGINITPGTSYTFSSTNSIPASLTGDSSELFVIPSGSYRKFTTTGVIKRNDGMIANRNISINKISLSEIGGVNEIYSITNGLEKLYTPTVLVEQVDNSNIKNGSFVSLLTGSVIDSNTNTVTHTISVGVKPYYAAAVGSYVYVTNSLSNTVSVINTATHSVAATIPVGSYPRGIKAHGTDL